MKPDPSFKSRRKRAPAVSAIPKAYDAVIALWTLRLIDMGGGLLAERRNRADLSREALEAAGLETSEGPPGRLARKAAVLAEGRFHAALDAAEESGVRPPTNTPIARNLAWLGKAAGLTATDQAILHFVLVGLQHAGLENALDQVGGLTLVNLHALLVRVLGLRRDAIARSLDPTSPLTRTGLLWVDNNANYPFRAKVEILPGLVDRLTGGQEDSWELFRSAFVSAPEPTLTLEDYPHVAKDLQILEPYLRESLRQRRKGVNILIHGTPGTGKTELVRTLTRQVGAELHEIASMGPRDESIEGDARFRGYRLAQAVLSRRGGHVIFFDEIEDVFRPREDSPRSQRNNVSGQKAWVNKILEENAVPAFWVTNHLHVLDDAFVRRFDFVLQLDNPPRSVRRRMLESNLVDLAVDKARKDQMAQHEGLSPALISRVASVARTVQSVLGQEDAGPVVTHLLGNSLSALGMSRRPREAVEIVTDYRPELVNTDCDLSPVLGGLRTHGSGRLCLYGPPGTGKTAYGRYLAEALDRPLLLKRASDILSPYIGVAERNIAAMFNEAMLDGAVLLLDEADTFLQDRAKAQRPWEVSEVNEMLTQMESFNGVYIASTNLMDQLDPAALRRFDLKVRFDYLRPEQAWIMFQDAARRLSIKEEGSVKPRIASLALLTPGDFATVIRQARMSRPKDAGELLARLEAECQAKPDYRRKAIGFGPKAS